MYCTQLFLPQLSATNGLLRACGQMQMIGDRQASGTNSLVLPCSNALYLVHKIPSRRQFIGSEKFRPNGRPVADSRDNSVVPVLIAYETTFVLGVQSLITIESRCRDRPMRLPFAMQHTCQILPARFEFEPTRCFWLISTMSKAMPIKTLTFVPTVNHRTSLGDFITKGPCSCLLSYGRFESTAVAQKFNT